MLNYLVLLTLLVYKTIGFKNLGCYRDRSVRALRHGPRRYGYNAITCSAACNSYRYFALQNDGWCSCDNDLRHATRYGRVSNCPENGGVWLNNLFSNPISCPSTAHLYAHCDNEGYYYISRNGGRTFSFFHINRHWTTASKLTITGINSNTVIRVRCIDKGVVGGFIATMRYNNYNYNTKYPLASGNWLIHYDQTKHLVYKSKTSAPWNIRTSEIDTKAQWVWTNSIRNTIQFDFNFKNVCPRVKQFIKGPTKMNYLEAYRYCRNMNSVLATIKNSAENRLANSLCGHPSCWIGFNDISAERSFTWLDGSSTSYTNWGPNEPNNVGSEHCVQIWGNGKWNDNDCITMQNYPLCNPVGSRPRYSSKTNNNIINKKNKNSITNNNNDNDKDDEIFVKNFNELHPSNKYITYSFYLNIIIFIVMLVVIGFGCYYNCVKAQLNQAEYAKVIIPSGGVSDSSTTTAV